MKKTWIAYAVYRLWVMRIRIYDFKGVSLFGLDLACMQRGVKSPWPARASR